MGGNGYPDSRTTRTPRFLSIRSKPRIDPSRTCRAFCPPRAPNAQEAVKAKHGAGHGNPSSDRPTPAVVLESTVACIHRIALAGVAPCALNFASAKNPGGGWLRGAQAQEEALCRASYLYSCIKGSPVHQLAKADSNNALYHDVAIFSPDVPVIKTDAGELLGTPSTVR